MGVAALIYKAASGSGLTTDPVRSLCHNVLSHLAWFAEGY